MEPVAASRTAAWWWQLTTGVVAAGGSGCIIVRIGTPRTMRVSSGRRLACHMRNATASCRAKQVSSAASETEDLNAPSGAPAMPDRPKISAVRGSASPSRSRASPPPSAVAPTAIRNHHRRVRRYLHAMPYQQRHGEYGTAAAGQARKTDDQAKEQAKRHACDEGTRNGAVVMSFSDSPTKAALAPTYMDRDASAALGSGVSAARDQTSPQPNTSTVRNRSLSVTMPTGLPSISTTTRRVGLGHALQASDNDISRLTVTSGRVAISPTWVRAGERLALMTFLGTSRSVADDAPLATGVGLDHDRVHAFSIIWCMATLTSSSFLTLITGDMMPPTVVGMRPEAIIACRGSATRWASRARRSASSSRRRCSASARRRRHVP